MILGILIDIFKLLPHSNNYKSFHVTLVQDTDGSCTMKLEYIESEVKELRKLPKSQVEKLQSFLLKLLKESMLPDTFHPVYLVSVFYNEVFMTVMTEHKRIEYTYGDRHIEIPLEVM